MKIEKALKQTEQYGNKRSLVRLRRSKSSALKQTEQYGNLRTPEYPGRIFRALKQTEQYGNVTAEALEEEIKRL